MADAPAGERGGFGRGFGRGDRGDRGGRGDRGRGDRGRGRRGPKREEEEKWVPVTKLGRLVKEGKIKSLEQIYLFSLPVKEHQIVEFFLGPALKDEVMKIMPVQKQTRAGQRTRFKAFVVVGDSNGHVGLGVKCSKEVATAIRGAIILAKISVIPVRRGYWGNMLGKPHTVPTKVNGKCGSVTVRLVPAPRGSGIVAARVPKKVLQFAGIDDVFTSSRGSTKTLGNFVKVGRSTVSPKPASNLIPERHSAGTFCSSIGLKFNLAANRVSVVVCVEFGEEPNTLNFHAPIELHIVHK
jgi:small subunit ribosomal protein S2e